MGVLAEYLKQEVQQLRAEITERQKNLQEWLAAVSRLYDLLEGWLREADNGLGLLSTDRISLTSDTSDQRLQAYGMWVTLGGAVGNRRAIILPKSRSVAAIIQPPGREPRRADGMVEIKPSFSSVPEYYLFRWKGESQDEWFLQNVNAWNSERAYGKVDPLDRDRFEAAILDVLR